MRSPTILAAAISLIGFQSVTAATIDVDVGNGAFVFKPDSVMAAVGDTINFHFFPGDHSVSQSTFAAPCVPSGPKAVNSGFVNPSGSGEASTMFSMKVNSTNTMWLYCAQVGHCQAGMSMVVNPGSGQTLAAYQSAAGGTTSQAPANVFGGILEPNMDSGSSSGTASASSSASSTSAAASASSSSSSTGGGPYGGGGTTSSTNAASDYGVSWKVLGLAMVPVVAFMLR